LNTDGSRLYVYDQDDRTQAVPIGKLRTYDVNAAPLPAPSCFYPCFVEVGTPIVLANNRNGIYTTDWPAAMALTVDGHAIIICGVAGCVIQPTPP
jgi:hypothetical protein